LFCCCRIHCNSTPAFQTKQAVCSNVLMLGLQFKIVWLSRKHTMLCTGNVGLMSIPGTSVCAPVSVSTLTTFIPTAVDLINGIAFTLKPFGNSVSSIPPWESSGPYSVKLTRLLQSPTTNNIHCIQQCLQTGIASTKPLLAS
jgi:hypothetical protein